MKKKIVAAFLVAALAVGIVFAFTACGVGAGSPGSLANKYVKASASFDTDGVINCMYFANDEDREAAKAEISEGFDYAKKQLTGTLGMDITCTASGIKYEKKSDMTEAELKTYQAACKEGDTVEAGERGTVSYTLKTKVTILGTETENTTDTSTTIACIKINGSWYIAA